jgi:hypothetical protein
MKEKGADVLILANPVTFSAYGPGKRPFPLLQRINQLTKPGKVREWRVWMRDVGHGEVAGRLCVIRKSEEAIRKAHRRLRRKESKKQTTLKPETFEFAR